ncbi:MAG: Lyzozyme M1 (1,4-beta-N-acetylmuramidase) [Lachnospiraceae bacterium]|nr:Lyzozyme M1 (1,4-beta-N-acetylmuramidase) [Lachnospiraceae bacterium]MBQ4069512.1 glycoside hydrolase family 25 protein [Lachnospiraceae bacterium]
MKNKILTITAMVVMIAMMICNVGMFLTVIRIADKDMDSKPVANQEESTEESTEEKVTISENDNTVISREEVLSYFDEDGEGTLGLLRDNFPEYIVYKEGNAYKFAKVNTSLAKNDWEPANLKKDKNGEMSYKKNGKVISKKGIDVSKYQGDIDWEKVKGDGVEYAIIRIAYRGYGSGEIVTDEKAIENIKNATKAGVKVGVYFFSQAINEKEAREEVQYLIELIKDCKIEYPIVFDMEEISGDTARIDKLTKEEKTDIAIAFCEEIKKEGYNPMIYANIKWFAGYYEMERIEKYDKWFAYYDDSLYFPYKIKMWQYTDSGKVDGIAGNVDLNIYVE